MSRTFLTLLLILNVSSCAVKHSNDYVKHKANSATRIPYDDVVISMASDQDVDFRGVYDRDNTVGSSAILYSGAAGPVGFLAQIFTHASLNANLQNKKRLAQQAEANKILEPFSLFISEFKQSDLQQDGENFHFFSGNAAPQKVHIKSEPIFFISQDLKHLVLKHKVSLQENAKQVPSYANLIEVISRPLSLNTTGEFDAEIGASVIIETSKELYKKSLKLMVSDLNGKLIANKQKQKSHRIYLGESFRVERGVRLEFEPENVLIRNLRGWLISYPASRLILSEFN